MGNEDFHIQSVSAEHLNISFEKWEQLLILMADKGYIKGIIIFKSLDNKFRHIVEPIQPEITIEGLEYLVSNSFMSKAKDMLKMTGDFV